MLASGSTNPVALSTSNSSNVEQEDSLSDMEAEENQFNTVQVFIRENILPEIINKAVDKSESKLYTKTGEIRKRKKFEEPLVERKKQKIELHKSS